MAKKNKKCIIGIDEVGRAASKRRASPYKYIIGIDEVGRGPLAGPVTVAAVALPRNWKMRKGKREMGFKKLPPLRDSKKLSPKKREEWFKYIKNHPKIHYAVASVPPKTIDKINISQAANLAATKAFLKLTTQLPKSQIPQTKIFLDGGLHLNVLSVKHQVLSKKIRKNPFLNLILSASTIVRGDEKIPAISLASIAAKVTRDKYMKKMHKKHPVFSFDKHKGYGTKLHYKMLKKHGFSKMHRKSFLK